MWIIFDLDDTLIDTSGSITPSALKNAVHVMHRSGCFFPSVRQAYLDLMAINAVSASATRALRRLKKRYLFSEEHLAIGMQALQDPSCWREVALVPQAALVLHGLKKEHKLVLVTRGGQKFQLKKMEKAGIDLSFFCSIFFCPNRSKKKVYEKFLLDNFIDAREVCVCGDRIIFDLMPAKALGCHTIHIKWGRGLRKTGLKRDVDYTINHLGQLYPLVKKISKEGA